MKSQEILVMVFPSSWHLSWIYLIFVEIIKTIERMSWKFKKEKLTRKYTPEQLVFSLPQSKVGNSKLGIDFGAALV